MNIKMGGMQRVGYFTIPAGTPEPHHGSRAFLGKIINKKEHALWVTNTGTRLTYWGLRQIIRRRANKAAIKIPRLHDFRRAFALQCLRNGMDVYSLQKLMGHSDLQVLQRYLAQTTEDIRKAHLLKSPVDNWSS